MSSGGTWRDRLGIPVPEDLILETEFDGNDLGDPAPSKRSVQLFISCFIY